MKKHIYCKTKIKSLALAIVALACFSGCIDNIDPDNPLGPLDKDNMLGKYVSSMQESIFPFGYNPYERTDDLCGNSYSGYLGTWNAFGGTNPLTYNFNRSRNWNDEMFIVIYGINGGSSAPGIMNSWNTIKIQGNDPNSVTYAIGEVVKVLGMHRAVDMYGPIVYSQYGSKLYPDYDSPKDIYKLFFEELDHAIGVLSNYYIVSPNSKPLGVYDYIYKSDILQWLKLANSLKLRLAMRISYVNDPDLNAQRYAEEAISNTYGVIENNSDNAKITKENCPQYNYPSSGYDEMRLGANMESFLTGYNDPRLPHYAQPSELDGKYHGIRSGQASMPSGYQQYSKITYTGTTPLYYLTASEVYFLRAEGAIRGWNMGGTAESLYNKGIETSMSQYGVTGSPVTKYIADATSKPAPYLDPLRPANSINSGDSRLSTITIKWEENDTFEHKLERIITQKWLALFVNGQEAWSEFRRTGYPKVFPVVNNNSGGSVNTEKQIRRIPLPFREYDTNIDAVQKAVTNYLDGNDTPGQKIWWDAK